MFHSHQTQRNSNRQRRIQRDLQLETVCFGDIGIRAFNHMAGDIDKFNLAEVARLYRQPVGCLTAQRSPAIRETRSFLNHQIVILRIFNQTVVVNLDGEGVLAFILRHNNEFIAVLGEGEA